MSNQYYDNIFSLRTSCNVEDAAAKMLGWLQGPVRYHLTEPEGGFNEQQLKYMDTLIYTLAEHLTDLRNAALLEASDAIKFDAAQAESNKVLEKILDIEDLGKRANLYIIDIEDELNKSDLSLLTIDKAATEKYNEIHITLKSLDNWAKKNYSISILGHLDTSSNNQTVISQNDSTKYIAPEAAISLHRRQEKVIKEVIITLGFNPKILPKNVAGKRGIKSKVKAALSEDSLFSGSTIFKKAWERLTDFDEIAYEDA